jgi:argininosuccinate synthase
MDRNLLHISFEAGHPRGPVVRRSAEKGARDVCAQCFAEEAPDKAEHVELVFEKGNCVAIGYHELDGLLADLKISDVKYDGDNHARLNPLQVMRVLNKLGGKHGIGRVTSWRTASSA